MSKGFTYINNGIVDKIVFVDPEDRKFADFKAMFTLTPEMSTPENHDKIIKQLFDEVGSIDADGHMIQVKLNYVPLSNSYQIETSLEPNQLLGAMWATGLINQEEMTEAYKQSGALPTHLNSQPQRTFKQQPNFSLF